MTRRPPLSTHRPSGKSAQAALLTLMGLGATAAGLALTLAPKFSWQAAQVLSVFDSLGVQGGTLMMGGLALLGLAMVLRQGAQTRVAAIQAGEDTGLLESVAADVLQVGSLLESLETSIAGLKNDLDGLRAKVAEVSVPAQKQPSEGLDSEDAIFRLAASMDKVGARIEERLKSQFTDLTGRLGKVETSLRETSVLIEKLEAPPAAVPAPMPAPAPQQPAHYATPEPHRAHEAPAPHPTAYSAAPDMRPEPDEAGSLGLLDELDDNGVASPLPAEQPVHFDHASELSLKVPPPAAGRWDDQPEPAPSQGLGSNPLAGDPEMRAALEDLGRQGRTH